MEQDGIGMFHCYHFRVKPCCASTTPLGSRPLVCFSGASFSFQPCILCLPVSLPLTHMFYFYFSSISPLSAFILLVFPFSGLLVTFPVLCDCPCQMLPITVRNMPSISPLILKRLKVQPSLPPQQTCGCQPLPPSTTTAELFCHAA